jgi:hypothetical protein
MKRIASRVVDRIANGVRQFIDRRYQDAQGRGLLEDPRSRATLGLLLDAMCDTKASVQHASLSVNGGDRLLPRSVRSDTDPAIHPTESFSPIQAGASASHHCLQDPPEQR